MSSTHRLHHQHTGQTGSDAAAEASEKKKVCSSCLEPFKEAAFHCNDCDYTVCQSCDNPKMHPAHPGHHLYYICPHLSWSCNICKHTHEHGILCYHCEECNFHLCKKCFADIKTPLHPHALHRADVREISGYKDADGNWACDVCEETNEAGNQ